MFYCAVSPWGPYLRLSRASGVFTLTFSGDGARWTNAGTFTTGGLSRFNYRGLGCAHERLSTSDEVLFEIFAVVDGVAGAALRSNAA